MYSYNLYVYLTFVFQGLLWLCSYAK